MSGLVRLRCGSCGYGVSARAVPDACPMCGGGRWEHEPWRPFSSLRDDLRPGSYPLGEVVAHRGDERRPT